MRAKLIYEKFDEDSDPIDDMDIGINHLIKKWIIELNSIRVPRLRVDEIINGKINIYGEVDISWSDLTIPDYIKFGVVSRNFSCCFNGSYHFFPDKAKTMRIFCYDKLATKENIKKITKIHAKNIRILDYTDRDANRI